MNRKKEMTDELLYMRQRRYRELMDERGFNEPGGGLELLEAHEEVVRLLDTEHPDYKVDGSQLPST
jgi:hypothetical protein